jgi:hypothetical protein
MCLVGGALWLLRPPGVGLSRRAWLLVAAGCALVLLSFMIDYRYALLRAEPPRFRWELFVPGVVMALVGVVSDPMIP